MDCVDGVGRGASGQLLEQGIDGSSGRIGTAYDYSIMEYTIVSTGRR